MSDILILIFPVDNIFWYIHIFTFPVENVGDGETVMGDPGEGREASLPRFKIIVIIIIIVIFIIIIIVIIVIIAI